MRGHGRFHTARPLKSVSVFVLYVITLCHYVETDIKYTLLKLCGKSCFFEIFFRFIEATLSQGANTSLLGVKPWGNGQILCHVTPYLGVTD
jgi:hypothetical protein